MSKYKGTNSGQAFYFLGMVGVFVYYMQHSQGIVDVLVGIAKSLVWPALLSYKVFELLKF